MKLFVVHVIEQLGSAVLIQRQHLQGFFCSGSGKLSEHVWLTFLSFHAPLFDNGGNIIVVIRLIF